MNYITVEVYRSSGSDCSMNGVTAPNSGVTLAVPVVRGYLTDEDVVERGYVILEAMPPAFASCPVRFKVRGETRMSMASGNFVYTSDSRFSETYGPAPVSVHDRIEA